MRSDPVHLHRIGAGLCLAGLFLAASGQAQQSGLAIEEIVVTAQKREQALQDVPIAVTAFTGSDLADRVIEDTIDLQFSVPNLHYDANRLTLRGVGNNAISSTAEGGLGYHVNGVYLNNPIVRSAEYYDIERIEVLRGPQGTLYGRNTTAGVINVIPQRPDDQWGGDLSLTVGDFESFKAKGAINIPITDSVRQRFSGLYFTREGYNENLFTGNDVDGRDSFEVRSYTSFDIGDNTTADLIVSYLREDSNRASETKGTCTKDPITGCSALSAGFETPDVSGSIFQVINGALGGLLMPAGDYFANANNPADFFTVNVDQEPTFIADEIFASFEVNHSIGDYTLTWLSGYQKVSSDRFQDFDRFVADNTLNFPLTYRANFRDFVTTDLIQSGRRDLGESEQVSHELRLASSRDSRFNFLVGAYYFDYEATNQVLIGHPALAFFQQVVGLPLDFEFFNIESDPIESDSWALFGEGYFDLSDRLRLTVGLRQTRDEKSVRTRQQFLTFVDPAWINAEDDWSVTTGKLSLDYSVTDNSLLYGTVARGYKAGGLNPGGPAGGQLFEPEFINVIELGSKNLFLNGRLRANVGAFYYDYEDLQIGQVSETSAITVNADATVIGAEAELTYAATDAFLIDVGISLLDVELDEFQSADEGDPNAIAPTARPALDANGMVRVTDSGNVIQNLEGNTLRNAPNSSLKVGLEYTFALGPDYDLTARADHFWQDEYFANEFNKPSDRIGSWSQTDAQLTLRKRDANWLLKLFSKNVFDSADVIRRGQDGPLVGRFRSVNVLEPRTVGLELQVSFD